MVIDVLTKLRKPILLLDKNNNCIVVTNSFKIFFRKIFKKDLPLTKEEFEQSPEYTNIKLKLKKAQSSLVYSEDFSEYTNELGQFSYFRIEVQYLEDYTFISINDISDIVTSKNSIKRARVLFRKLTLTYSSLFLTFLSSIYSTTQFFNAVFISNKNKINIDLLQQEVKEIRKISQENSRNNENKINIYLNKMNTLIIQIENLVEEKNKEKEKSKEKK